MQLVKISKENYPLLVEMLDEWTNDIKINSSNNSPSSIFKNDYHDFDNYFNNLEIKEEKDGLVIDSIYFLLDEERNIFIGAVNIRHSLNDYLLKYGGHIGDGIRPSERRKGYATLLLSLALEKCKELNINKVLMICDKNNIGSRKSIINNGGILENEIIDEDGNILQRYWITLDK